MNRVLLLHERLAALEWPSIDRFQLSHISESDTVVVCAGFEDRSLALLETLIESGVRGIELIVIFYQPFEEANRADETISLASQLNPDFSTFTYDRLDPDYFGERLLESLSGSSSRIFFDISAMSRILITQMIVACSHDPGLLSRANIIYCEAEDYPPSEEEVRILVQNLRPGSVYRSFLSSGVIELLVTSDLSSVSMQGQPVRLIAFPSFNVDQLSALRGEIQPAMTSVINGRPPDPDKEWRLEAIRHLNRITELSRIEEYEASTLDYRETLRTLIEIYDRYGSYEKLIVAPTGSKAQTVAVGIFRAFMADCQVVYPLPRTFLSRKTYTTGCREIYTLSLSRFLLISESDLDRSEVET